MITREQAEERAVAHVAAQLHKEIRVTEGWADGAFRSSDEPVWAIRLPPETLRVGASRCVIVSQTTDRVIADGFFGE